LMFKHHCRKRISLFDHAFLQCKILLLSHGTKSMNLDTMPCVKHPKTLPLGPRWRHDPGARGGGGPDAAARPLDRTRVMRTRRGEDQSHEDDASRGDGAPLPKFDDTRDIRSTHSQRVARCFPNPLLILDLSTPALSRSF